jgi:hypothetical protein
MGTMSWVRKGGDYAENEGDAYHFRQRKLAQGMVEIELVCANAESLGGQQAEEM